MMHKQFLKYIHGQGDVNDAKLTLLFHWAGGLKLTYKLHTIIKIYLYVCRCWMKISILLSLPISVSQSLSSFANNSEYSSLRHLFSDTDPECDNRKLSRGVNGEGLGGEFASAVGHFFFGVVK